MAANAYEDSPVDVGLGAVPDEVEDRLLAAIEADYEGTVTDTYQGARTSLGHWATLEPSNTSGLLVSARNTENDIYALFFKGSFVNVGPMTSDGLLRTKFNSGRIVGTETDILSIQLWQSPENALVPFGPLFDDS